MNWLYVHCIIILHWNFCPCSHAGLVFDNLEGGDLAYTIRLRHEVGNADSWNTERAGGAFQLPGARVQNRYVFSESRGQRVPLRSLGVLSVACLCNRPWLWLYICWLELFWSLSTELYKYYAFINISPHT